MKARKLIRTMAALVCAASVSAAGACSAPLGLPTRGDVTTLAPIERQDRRVYTVPDGPEADAQPESVVEGFFAAMPAGVQSDGFAVAREFLTDGAAERWNGDESAIIYSGAPTFVRKPNVDGGSSMDEAGILIQATLHIIGRIDGQGLYSAVGDDPWTVTFTLHRQDGQWRIDQLPQGVMVSVASFDQAFRQVSLYRPDVTGTTMVPDVRWLSWRNWRTRAMEELLGGVPDWLEGAVSDVADGRVGLQVDAVPMESDGVAVRLDEGFAALDAASQAMLVRQIRLTLGDGTDGQEVNVLSGGETYSGAEGTVDLDVADHEEALYALSGGNVVSLESSSPVRVAQNTGIDEAEALVFGESGGAVLRADGVAECLDGEGMPCGVLFDGAPVSTVAEGVEGEVWGVAPDGRTLVVSRQGRTARIAVPDLGTGSIHAVAVSPEGARLAMAVGGGPDEGVLIAGIVRNGTGMAERLCETWHRVSSRSDVSMLTFYNDITLVYATDGASARQQAFRQLTPGPETAQSLPDSTVTSIATGDVSRYHRLAVFDDLGIVRTASGSLEGAWTIVYSQAEAMSAR